MRDYMYVRSAAPAVTLKSTRPLLPTLTGRALGWAFHDTEEKGTEFDLEGAKTGGEDMA